MRAELELRNRPRIVTRYHGTRTAATYLGLSPPGAREVAVDGAGAVVHQARASLPLPPRGPGCLGGGWAATLDVGVESSFVVGRAGRGLLRGPPRESFAFARGYAAAHPEWGSGAASSNLAGPTSIIA